MTVAVCIKCGEKKHGALTPCPECRFDPTENIDKAKSMILTDHFLSHEDLDSIGDRIRAGQPVTYPVDAIAEYVTRFEQGADGPSKAVWVGRMMVAVVVLCVVAYLALHGVW